MGVFGVLFYATAHNKARAIHTHILFIHGRRAEAMLRIHHYGSHGFGQAMTSELVEDRFAARFAKVGGA